MSSKCVCLVVALFVCIAFIEIAFADDAAFGDEGQQCGKSGTPMPLTVCSNWCPNRSPVGDCNGGLQCCAVIDDKVAPNSAEGQQCVRRGIPIPHTVCNHWCPNRSSVGSCSGGFQCCAEITNEE